MHNRVINTTQSLRAKPSTPPVDISPLHPYHPEDPKPVQLELPLTQPK